MIRTASEIDAAGAVGRCGDRAATPAAPVAPRSPIPLRHCTVTYTPDGCTTRFPDGTSYGAHPHPGLPHYSVIAHRCGYQDDLVGYAREHELCHSIIAEWFADAPSLVLWALAHGDLPDPYQATAEECLAQTLQRWVRANERPIIGGVDWDGLRGRFLGVLA